MQILIILELFGNNGSLNILVACAAVRAASAERAAGILGKAYFVALRAYLAVVGTVPSLIAYGAAILCYILATDITWRAFGSSTFIAKLGTTTIILIFGIHAGAAVGAMQVMLSNTR